MINILLFFFGWLCCKFAGKILVIPKPILALLIVALSSVGAFSIQQNMMDVIVMYVAGVLGYFLDRYGYPLSPVALALLLGPMLEEAIMLTGTMYSNFFMIFTRPLTDVFVLFIFVSLGWPIIKKQLKKRKEAA